MLMTVKKEIFNIIPKIKLKEMNNIKFITAAEAVKCIKSGDHIHLSSVASAPQCLIKAM